MVINCLVWRSSSCVRDTADFTMAIIIIISHFIVRKGSGMSRHLKSDHDRGGCWARTRTQKVRTIVPSPDTVLTVSQECGRQLWASSELSSCMESSVHVVWRQRLGHPPWGEWSFIAKSQAEGRPGRGGVGLLIRRLYLLALLLSWLPLDVLVVLKSGQSEKPERS